MTGICQKRATRKIVFEYKFELLCLDMHASSHFKNREKEEEEKKIKTQHFFEVTSETLMHRHKHKSMPALMLVGFC